MEGWAEEWVVVLAVAALEAVWVVAGFLETDARACSACRNSFAAPRNEKRPGIICPRQAAFPSAIGHAPIAHILAIARRNHSALPFWPGATQIAGGGAAHGPACGPAVVDLHSVTIFFFFD